MSYSPKAELSSCENNERGFTIIELVVGLAISLILLGVAVKIFLVQQRSYSVQEQLSEMQQNIRSAMDMIVRETKMAGYDPTGTAFSSSSGIIYNVDTSKLQILADLTGNGDTDDANEDIIYDIDNTTDPDHPYLRRNSQPLAENITEFTVLYFDANYGQITDIIDEPNIRQIKITITGRTDKTDPDLKRVDGDGHRYGTLTTHITPENLDF